MSETKETLFGCYDALLALVEDLSADEWDVQSYCPAWTVRGVVGHLVGVEYSLLGWVPVEGEKSLPFGKVAEFEEMAQGWSNEEWVEQTKTILNQRRDEVSTMDPAVFEGWAMTPVGEGTYRRFMDIRVFDFWVHQRDMCMPLGRETDDSGAAAEVALDEVHNSIGYIAGKKIGLPDQASIAIELAGPVQRNIYAKVDGRAAKVDSLDGEPTVTLTTDSTTFIMLACGRIDPQTMIDQGKISWTGDAELGDRAARNLAFTM